MSEHDAASSLMYRRTVVLCASSHFCCSRVSSFTCLECLLRPSSTGAAALFWDGVLSCAGFMGTLLAAPLSRHICHLVQTASRYSSRCAALPAHPASCADTFPALFSLSRCKPCWSPPLCPRRTRHRSPRHGLTSGVREPMTLPSAATCCCFSRLISGSAASAERGHALAKP